MRLLLAFVVILALTLTLWVMVGGVPLEIPIVEPEVLFAERAGESLSLSDPGSDPSTRTVVEAEGAVRYRLVDGESGAALHHAEIYAILSGERLAECDADGQAELSNKDPGQLFYLADGYLLGFFLADRRQLLALRAQAKTLDVTIELYRDPFSFPLELTYLLPSGKEAEQVKYMLQLAEPEGRAVAFLKELRGHSAGVRRAWGNEQKAPSHSAGLHKPRLIEPRNRKPLKARRLRFYLPGIYQITATAKGGFRLEREVWIGPETESLRISLAPGNRITGRVFDGITGKPLKSIRISLNRGPFDLPVSKSSDEGGRFSFESLGDDAKRLAMSHGGYETLVLPAVAPGSELSLTMTPHPRRELRGRVLTHGNDMPVVGALVRIFDTETRTKDDGSFFLGSVRTDGYVLHIEAEGHYPIDKTLASGSAARDYAMIPDQPEARVAAGITALLSGRVLHPDGKAVTGMDLKLTVNDEWFGTGAEKASFLIRLQHPGLKFFPPGELTCDADGNFMIECSLAGSVSLQPMDGESPPFEIHVTLGQRYENLVIYTKN